MIRAMWAIAIRRIVPVVLLVSPLFAYDTVGCALHIDPSRFNHANLVELTWTADILEDDTVPTGFNPFKLRLDFAFPQFMGAGLVPGDTYPFMAVTTAVQNVGHSFADDAVGRTTTFPAVGLYLSSLQSRLADSQHGVRLNANEAAFPNYGRIFEDEQPPPDRRVELSGGWFLSRPLTSPLAPRHTCWRSSRTKLPRAHEPDDSLAGFRSDARHGTPERELTFQANVRVAGHPAQSPRIRAAKPLRARAVHMRAGLRRSSGAVA